MTTKNDPQVLWTYLIHGDHIPSLPSNVFAHREDAIGEAERDWMTNYERLVKGESEPPPKPVWALVPTDTDLTIATPWDGVTILVYPLRLRGAVSLSSEDTRRLVPVLSLACEEAEASLEGKSMIVPDPMVSLRESYEWGRDLLARMEEVG